MIFVDASAIVAILTREPEADVFADILDRADTAITSPIAVFEATLGICRKRNATVQEAQGAVADLLGAANIETVAVAAKEAEVALDAAGRYGKGRGHPAQLNMGDCFAYAIAKTRGAALLFKGDDFGLTDVFSAMDTR